MNNEESGGGSYIAPKSKYNEVDKFFPVCVDDFFDDPERIVNYAKSLPKKPDPEGTWPGKRTELLWKIDKDLATAILLKIMSCYYDLTYQNVSWKRVNMCFQETPAYCKTKNDVRNKGWIHFDASEDFEIAGLIYLTPDIDLDSGTSLFKLKKQNDEKYRPDPISWPRQMLHRNKNGVTGYEEEFDEEYFTKKYKEHENLFIEKTRFANIYNRMIMYDTNEFHRANSYYNDAGKDARLTLVFFIGGLNIDTYPLERPRDKENDEFITERTLMTRAQYAKIQSDERKK